MSSRNPLSSVRPNSAAAANSASLLKRPGAKGPSAAEVKKPRISTETTTAAATAGPSTRLPRAPTPTNAVATRPLANSMMTGRATTMGIVGSSNRSGLRQPSTITRTRTVSGSSASRGMVDGEKEKMREELEEMKKKMEEKEEEMERKDKEMDLLKREKDEMRTSNDELRRELVETKGEIRTEKRVRETTELELQEERRSHDETRRLLDASKERESVLKREALDKEIAMRRLHNEVVDLKGRIRVAVRVRPLLKHENQEQTDHLTYPDGTTIGFATGKDKVQPFSFNHVYGPNYSQKRVFETVQDLILSVLHGYNVSLISFGQTGSGKTFTMRGAEGELEGLIPRAVRFLFEQRRRLEDLDWRFEFSGSFLEVYNNECFDLLSTPARAKCEVKRVSDGKFGAENLTKLPIVDAGSMVDLLRKSDRNRTTAATNCNETSSRSHAIFGLYITGHNATTKATINCVLRLVDLAGSERAKETGATGDRFVEMTHINTALSNLQTCIRAIHNKQSHIPYRNSKLTSLLQDSLGGESKCMVILSLSPQESVMNETKRSLEFGKNMSQTHIGVARKKET